MEPLDRNGGSCSYSWEYRNLCWDNPYNGEPLYPNSGSRYYSWENRNPCWDNSHNGEPLYPNSGSCNYGWDNSRPSWDNPHNGEPLDPNRGSCNYNWTGWDNPRNQWDNMRDPGLLSVEPLDPNSGHVQRRLSSLRAMLRRLESCAVGPYNQQGSDKPGLTETKIRQCCGSKTFFLWGDLDLIF
jgi:hypothetical protein